jgi:hypothetical protein
MSNNTDFHMDTGDIFIISNHFIGGTVLLNFLKYLIKSNPKDCILYLFALYRFIQKSRSIFLEFINLFFLPNEEICSILKSE